MEWGDYDGDGDIDAVITGHDLALETSTGQLYRNDGGGLVWTQIVVATGGSHNLRIGDIGGDGDDLHIIFFADRCGCRFQRLGPACVQHKVHTGGGQRFGAATAQAL